MLLDSLTIAPGKIQDTSNVQSSMTRSKADLPQPSNLSRGRNRTGSIVQQHVATSRVLVLEEFDQRGAQLEEPQNVWKECFLVKTIQNQRK